MIIEYFGMENKILNCNRKYIGVFFFLLCFVIIVYWYDFINNLIVMNEIKMWIIVCVCGFVFGYLFNLRNLVDNNRFIVGLREYVIIFS